MATIENFDMGGGGFEITLENPSLEDLQDEEKKKKKKVSLSSSKIMSIIASSYFCASRAKLGTTTFVTLSSTLMLVGRLLLA